MNLIQFINTSLIIPNPNNKRRSLSDNESADNKLYQTIDGLAQNIREVGLINALTVTPFGSAYMIIAGERRYQACKQLGWSEIPCLVMQATDEEQRWIMLSENLQRKDLSEVEKGEQFKDAVSQRPESINQIAKKIGIGNGYLKNLLSLANYPPPVKQMVKSEEISAYQARPLSQLKTPEEQIKAAEHIRDNHLDYGGAKKVVDEINSLPPEKKDKLKNDSETKVSDVLTVEVITDTVENQVFAYDYQSFMEVGQKLYDILEIGNVSNFNSYDKMTMKEYLLSLKQRINDLLDRIDEI